MKPASIPKTATISHMHALRVLEFGRILERLAHHCETPIAAARALELRPSFDDAEVRRMLAATREAHDLIARHGPPSLGSVRDPREALNRASKMGSLGGEELFGIADAMAAMRAFAQFLKPKQTEYPLFYAQAALLPEIPRLESALFDSLEPSGEVKDGASSELRSIRQRKKTATSRILERIQSYTSGPARDLLSDPIYTVRDGRYVVPVKSENRGKVRGIVHDTSATGATVFVEPEDVLQLGNAVRELEAREREEISRILATLSGKVGAVAEELATGIEAVAGLDFALAKARLAFEQKAATPDVYDGHFIDVRQGRHPLLEAEKVVPLDLSVGKESQGVLITGPNTGGKTVALKAVGLMVAMAQSGMFVPAIHCTIGVFTQIWADIGDEQSLEQSLSTFSGHVKNIAAALTKLKPGALVLFDELGAGTDPAEGAALAKAILATMQERGAVVVASTHYGELKAFAYSQPGFINAAMEFDSKTLRPTYRLLLGAPGASQALRIAERYGIPAEVVERAKEGLSEQHLDVTRMMEELERAQLRARQAQSEADRRTAELAKLESKALQKIADAEASRKRAHEQARYAIDEGLRELRLQAADLMRELKRSPGARAAAKDELAALQSLGEELAKPFRGSEPTAPLGSPHAISKGMAVKVQGYSQPGVVLEFVKDGQALVQLGIVKMAVPIESLQPIVGKAVAAAPRRNLRFEKAQTASSEVQLIGMRAEEAERSLLGFLDEAALAGIDKVRIVHGKGEGILRKMTMEALRRHPAIANYHEADPAEGGAGVTIAVLR